VKTVGMFIEFGPVKQAEPQDSIKAHIGPGPLPDVDKVVGYLRSGHPLIDMMDIQDDVLDSSQRPIMNGSSIATDGDWLWRNDLAYYVRRHNVALPDEFLQLIRQRNYTVPHVDDAVLDAAGAEAGHLMF
jgi:hypothetical protein